MQRRENPDQLVKIPEARAKAGKAALVELNKEMEYNGLVAPRGSLHASVQWSLFLMAVLV